MANNGSTSVAVTKYDTLKFSWWQNSQSITNNTTTISWKLELIASSYGRIDSTASKAWSVTVNGVTTSGTNKVGISNNSTKTLATGSSVIKHNSDGTKTFSYSFSQEFKIVFSDSNIGTKTGSGSGTLNVIPRISSLTVANGTLNTSQTMTVNRSASNFTHTITYLCGTTFGVVCTKSSETSLTWKPPLDLAEESTTTSSVSVTFTIETFNGSTSIGTNKTTAIFAIPDSVVPPVAYTSSDPAELAGYYGAYIQGKSKVMLDITSYGVYGSWLKSCIVNIAGKTYPVSSLSTSKITVTSDAIVSTGEVPISVSVTDSRERTTEAKSSVTVLPYEAPKITALSAYRTDASGKATSDGEYITVKFSSNVYALNNKNGAWYKVVYKKVGESNETTVDVNAYKDQFAVTNGTYTFKVDTSSYDVLLQVGDKLNTVQKRVVAPSIEKVFSFRKKLGKIVGMGWGKLAELEGVFDIAYQTRFNGGILHQILPTNSDLDFEKTPKTYLLPSTNTYTNTPETGANMFLEIVGEKNNYVTQRISVFAKQRPRTYERSFYTGGWGDWVCTSGDFVVDRGESNGWTYRKWHSGVAECWKILTHRTTITTAWGALYHGTATARQAYPIQFVDKPFEQATLTAGSYQALLFPEKDGNGVNGASASACYNVCRPSAITSTMEFYINISVKGKWK